MDTSTRGYESTILPTGTSHTITPGLTSSTMCTQGITKEGRFLPAVAVYYAKLGIQKAFRLYNLTKGDEIGLERINKVKDTLNWNTLLLNFKPNF